MQIMSLQLYFNEKIGVVEKCIYMASTCRNSSNAIQLMNHVATHFNNKFRDDKETR